MKNNLIYSFLIALNILMFTTPSAFAVCGAEGTDGKCGVHGGCELPSQMCTDGWLEDTCETDPSCENADHSQGIVCEDNWDADYKCGPAAGGCAEGFMCRNPWGGGNARCVEINPDVTDPSCVASIPPLECSQTSPNPERPCNCAAVDNQLVPLDQSTTFGYCCGFKHVNGCYATQAEQQEAILNGQTETPEEPEEPGTGGTPEEPVDPGTGGGEEEEEPAPEIDIFDGPTSENFDALNPLTMFGNADAQALRSPGAIVSRMLLFAFPLAGLILFVMIVWGGFEMLTSAASKGVEAGKQRVTAAIVGFTLLFVAYWIFQIVEVIFGVVIL